MNKTKNDIALENRKKLSALLNENLAHLIDLQLQTKQAHWNVKGPHFIGLHLLFDKVNEEVEEFIDSVAERITQLGGVAEGTRQAVTSTSKLPEYSLKISSGHDHVEALSSALAFVGKAVREGIDAADDLEDKDTADLLTDVSRGLDKNLWFVEAHLQAER